MALATLRSGGIEREGLLVDRGDRSFFSLLGFCCGGEYRNLPMGGRFRPRRQLFPAVARGTGFSGCTRILGQSHARLDFNARGLNWIAGPGDSILAQECCVT